MRGALDSMARKVISDFETVPNFPTSFGVQLKAGSDILTRFVNGEFFNIRQTVILNGGNNIFMSEYFVQQMIKGFLVHKNSCNRVW